MTFESIGERLYHSFIENESREALPGITYKSLGQAVENYRRRLRQLPADLKPVGIVSNKVPATYAMWLACWLEGRAVVFLSSAAGSLAMTQVLEAVDPALVFSELELEMGTEPLSPAPHISSEQIAYYISTSGSTGSPKVIRVSYKSLHAWIQNSASTWDVWNTDRVSQIFDLSFDPAISDFLWAFLSGACLVPMDLRGQINAPDWILTNQISLWSSSPSQAKTLVLSRELTAGALPCLRRSTFIGEILTRTFVQNWSTVANNSVIENHYGPAECVISVSREKINLNSMPDEILSVGPAFPGVRVLIDQDLLTIESDQVADGYVGFQSDAFHFSKDQRFYHTGDEAILDDAGKLKITGRKDFQIKLHGQRWELEGIEATIEKNLGVPVYVQFWKTENTSGLDLVILGRTPEGVQMILNDIFRGPLPPSLRPRNVWLRTQVPINSHGKLDRKTIQYELEQGKLAPLGN